MNEDVMCTIRSDGVHESCTEQVNDSLSIREPSQTPDTRHHKKTPPTPTGQTKASKQRAKSSLASFLSQKAIEGRRNDF